MAEASSKRRPLRALVVLPGGQWHGDIRDVVVLNYEDRHRRRLAMSGVRGLDFVLDLPRAIVLRGGDALELEDGSRVEVVAAPEPLAEIRTSDEAGAVRIAWHLGNRHLPVQVVGRRLRVRRDHVIEAMIAGLGGVLQPIEAPFDPESGAYAGHAHTDNHEHAASHANRHE